MFMYVKHPKDPCAPVAIDEKDQAQLLAGADWRPFCARDGIDPATVTRVVVELAIPALKEDPEVTVLYEQ
jgi:hypothetical protein